MRRAQRRCEHAVSGTPGDGGGAEPSGYRPSSSRPRLDRLCLGLLAAAFLLSILIVGPGGEFPLNDDWSFVRSVRVLVAAQDWRPLGWASMTQISNALLGYVVCSLSSCSFEHLRAATLLAALALLLGCFGLYRWNGASRLASALAACAVAFNPVLYPLAYTFMTDVGFALLMVVAAPACLAALRTGRWRFVLLASALLLAATLSRQLGIALAAALLPLYVFSSREPLALRVAKAGLPLAVCLTALLSYEHWMRQSGRLPALYDEKYGDLVAALASPSHVFATALVNLLLSLTYLGLLCLPVLLLRRLGRGVKAWRVGPAARWASVATIAVLLLMVQNRTLMPLLGNVLERSGIGPFTLRDTYILGLHDVPDLPVAFWVGVSVFALLGLWLLVFHVTSLLVEVSPRARAGRLDAGTAARCFGLVATILYLIPLLPGEVYDRYVAAVAPILCLSLLGNDPDALGTRRPVPTVLACVYAIGLAVVSIAATHDYLAWNRARWSAITSVEATHEADPTTMDGGFEYNGYHSYDPRYESTPTKSWWWVADDAIQIGFGPMPGTEVLRRIPYGTWFPPDSRSIAVLRRTSPSAVP